MSLPPTEEGLHPSGPDESWQESVYLAWCDLKAGLGGNHRIGHEHNRNTTNMWCGVYRDDGTQFRHNAEHMPIVPCATGYGLRCGPQQFFSDGTRLRFVLDTKDCKLDLVVHDYPGDPQWLARQDNKLEGRIYSTHYNGHCHVTGVAELDGRHHAIEALGWRDHSWGPRRWDTIVCSRSLGGGFGPAFSFSAGQFLGTDGVLHNNAMIVRHGVRERVKESELYVLMEGDGICARAMELFVVTQAGEPILITGEVMGGMIGQTRERCGFESIVRVTLKGQHEGWGFLEINTNPRQGRTDPVLVLHGGLQNGMTRRTPRLKERYLRAQQGDVS